MIAARSTGITLLSILIVAACGCSARSSINAKRGNGPVKPASLSDYIRAVYKLSTESSADAQRRADVLAKAPQLAELVSRAGENPGDTALRSELVAAYMEHKLYREAYELLMDSHVADPADSPTNLNLARVWDIWGQYDLALQYAERGVSSGTPTGSAFELLGRIHLHRNRPAEAVTWFTRALQEDGRNASILTNLGYANMLGSNWQQAREHLEEALRADPTVPEAHNNLAIVLVRLGDETEAFPHLLKTGTPAVATNNMGVLYLQQNKFEEARLFFQEALRLEPSYERAQRNLQAALSAVPPPSIIQISSFSRPVSVADSAPAARADVYTESSDAKPAEVVLAIPIIPDTGIVPDRALPVEDEGPRVSELAESHSAVRLPPSIVSQKPVQRAQIPMRETLYKIVRLEHRGLNIAGLAGAFILTGLFALRPRKSEL